MVSTQILSNTINTERGQISIMQLKLLNLLKSTSIVHFERTVEMTRNQNLPIFRQQQSNRINITILYDLFYLLIVNIPNFHIVFFGYKNILIVVHHGNYTFITFSD